MLSELVLPEPLLLESSLLVPLLPGPDVSREAIPEVLPPRPDESVVDPVPGLVERPEFVEVLLAIPVEPDVGAGAAFLTGGMPLIFPKVLPAGWMRAVAEPDAVPD